MPKKNKKPAATKDTKSNWLGSWRGFMQRKKSSAPRRRLSVGYLGLTRELFGFLWQEKRPLLILAAIHMALTVVFAGVMSQSDYLMVSQSLREVTAEIFGSTNQLLSNTVLFGVTIGGGINTGMSELQQAYVALLNFVTWLVLVWLLRQRLAGVHVKVRDALYNGTSPFISSLLVLLLGVIQLIPAALGLLVISIASQAGLLQGSIETVLFIAAAILLILLSFYWLSATVIAAVVVTLPSTYPVAALKSANQVVAGRRAAIVARLLWWLLVILLLWAVVLIPIIVLDSAISAEWLPLVPITSLVLGTFTLIASGSYLYLFYRKLIEDESD